MQFKTQAIRSMKTGKEDTRKRRARLTNIKHYNLDGLVRFALDNNYIEGAKYELSKGIVKGVIEAQRELVRMGNAVSIDGWVKYEPRLRGSVDAIKRQITADNHIIVGVTALKEMKLAIGDFSFTCIDEKEELVPPYITSVTCAGHEDGPDRLFDGCSVTIHGVGLADAGTAMFEFTDKAGAGHEFTLGDEMLVEKSDTAYLIDSSLVVESMRTICLEEGSELDTAAGATAVLPFPDGKQASRHVAFG